MTPEERIESQLRSPEPGGALRSLVHELSQEGRSKADIYELFETFVTRLRLDPHRGSDEDTLLDVMDALSGWCHPGARLLPDDEPAGEPRQPPDDQVPPVPD